MKRKLRISSPQVFETVLSKSKIFQNYDWLFDIHPGIVSSFRPDVRIFFDSSATPLPNEFGNIATINRQLVAHSSLILSSCEWSHSELEAQTYITMAHNDDSCLSVAAADGPQTLLRPSKVFRANDVLAAEIAVKLKIGYSALPVFLANNESAGQETHLFFSGWKVSPTYLQVLSSGPADMRLSKIHEEIHSALIPLVSGPWRSFGQTQNVIPIGCSNG